MNQAPQNGECVISPKEEIYALTTKVNVSCNGWYDTGDENKYELIYYRYLIRYQESGYSVHIDGGETNSTTTENSTNNSPVTSFYLGVGNYSIFAEISDGFGATNVFFIGNVTTKSILTNLDDSSDSTSDSTSGDSSSDEDDENGIPIEEIEQLLNLTTYFLEENLFDTEISSIGDASIAVLSAVSILDSIDTSSVVGSAGSTTGTINAYSSTMENPGDDDDDDDDKDDNDDDGDDLSDEVTEELKEIRGEIIDVLVNDIFVNLTENVNTSDVNEYQSFLTSKTEILTMIVGKPSQISTDSGKTVITEFGTVMDDINRLDRSNKTKHESPMNDDTANALASGVVNCGLAFVNENNNENNNKNNKNGTNKTLVSSETTIQVTQFMLDVVMTTKVVGSLPGESGYHYEDEEISLTMDTKRHATDDSQDNICGDEYIAHNNVRNIVNESGNVEFNCLFCKQPKRLYGSKHGRGARGGNGGAKNGGAAISTTGLSTTTITTSTNDDGNDDGDDDGDDYSLASDVISLTLTIVDDSALDESNITQIIEDLFADDNTYVGEARRNRRQLTGTIDDVTDVINVRNTSYCDSFVFLMYHTSGTNISGYFGDDATQYFDGNRTISIGVCRYYDTLSETWKTDGCEAISSNETVTVCRCSHLTNFAVSEQDFVPTINVISVEYLENVTIENLIKHPTAFIGIISILLIFGILMLCLPRLNDKPIVSQLRPWSQLQSKKWKQTYDCKYDKIAVDMISKNETCCKTWIKLSWLDISNKHYVVSLFLRDYSTNFGAPQRLFCFLASVVTMTTINGAYYGRVDMSFKELEMSAIANYLYASLFGSLIPLILSLMFTCHRPSVAVRRPHPGFYQVFKRFIEQQRINNTGKMKLDQEQIEFDVLGLLAQKDINFDGVKGHSKLKSFKFKQLFTKQELLKDGIERHIRSGKSKATQRRISMSIQSTSKSKSSVPNASKNNERREDFRRSTTIAHTLQMVTREFQLEMQAELEQQIRLQQQQDNHRRSSSGIGSMQAIGDTQGEMSGISGIGATSAIELPRRATRRKSISYSSIGTTSGTGTNTGAGAAQNNFAIGLDLESLGITQEDIEEVTKTKSSLDLGIVNYEREHTATETRTIQTRTMTTMTTTTGGRNGSRLSQLSAIGGSTAGATSTVHLPVLHDDDSVLESLGEFTAAPVLPPGDDLALESMEDLNDNGNVFETGSAENSMADLHINTIGNHKNRFSIKALSGKETVNNTYSNADNDNDNFGAIGNASDKSWGSQIQRGSVYEINCAPRKSVTSFVEDEEELSNYLRRDVSWHSLNQNHGKVLMNHFQESNQIVFTKSSSFSINSINSINTDRLACITERNDSLYDDNGFEEDNNDKSDNKLDINMNVSCNKSESDDDDDDSIMEIYENEGHRRTEEREGTGASGEQRLETSRIGEKEDGGSDQDTQSGRETTPGFISQAHKLESSASAPPPDTLQDPREESRSSIIGGTRFGGLTKRKNSNVGNMDRDAAGANGTNSTNGVIPGMVDESKEIKVISDSDHAILMLIQSYLIEITYKCGHFSVYAAWILGTLWIFTCSAIIIIYGVNFDLLSEYEANYDDDNNDSRYVIDSSHDFNISNSSSECNTQFSGLNDIPLTDKINYNISKEYALIHSGDETHMNDLWTDIDDSQSWLLSFLLSFILSITVWTPLATVLTSLMQLCLIRIGLYDYYFKPNMHYMQAIPIRAPPIGLELGLASGLGLLNDDLKDFYQYGYKMNYTNIDKLRKNLNEIETENDLWKAIAYEINVKALCQYPLWVLQHPYVRKLRQFLIQDRENRD